MRITVIATLKESTVNRATNMEVLNIDAITDVVNRYINRIENNILDMGNFSIFSSRLEIDDSGNLNTITHVFDRKTQKVCRAYNVIIKFT